MAERVKSSHPFYAHVAISPYGLQFEYPEHHFLKDLKSAFAQLDEIRSQIFQFPPGQTAPKERRDDARDLVSREKFLSRSIISASFSLVEAFLSGIFYSAIQTGSFGQLACTEEFLSYAKKRESAPLRDRLNHIVEFASEQQATVDDEPFKNFIAVGKRYRDAIHHTTPFARKDIGPGDRLAALYEINGDIALQIALFSFESILRISDWAYEDSDTTAIATDCNTLFDRAIELLRGGSGSEKV